MKNKRSEQWQTWVEKICKDHPVSPKGKGAGKFEPSPDDTFKLAALQWWSHEIARVMIEVYATDRRQFDRMSNILSDARAALRSLAGAKKLMAEGDACSVDQDCPRGFFCDAGTCEPLDANGPMSS